jgi:hypothetical protein
MKPLKVKERLTSNKGEMLVETLMSLVIFAILLGAVFLIVTRSQTMTSNSIREARVMQQGEVNPALMEAYVGSSGSGTTTISFFGGGITASHSIIFNARCPTCPPSCARSPNCTILPCPVCCGCNDMVAFTPGGP